MLERIPSSCDGALSEKKNLEVKFGASPSLFPGPPFGNPYTSTTPNMTAAPGKAIVSYHIPRSTAHIHASASRVSISVQPTRVSVSGKMIEWKSLVCQDIYSRIIQSLIFSQLANDQGNRTTPSYVAFTDSERLIGDAAKNQTAMNPHKYVQVNFFLSCMAHIIVALSLMPSVLSVASGLTLKSSQTCLSTHILFFVTY